MVWWIASWADDDEQYKEEQPREGLFLAGAMNCWEARVGKKEAYLEGELRSKWEEWRAEWCWIVEENPQPFTALRQSPNSAW